MTSVASSVSEKEGSLDREKTLHPPPLPLPCRHHRKSPSLDPQALSINHPGQRSFTPSKALPPSRSEGSPPQARFNGDLLGAPIRHQLVCAAQFCMDIVSPQDSGKPIPSAVRALQEGCQHADPGSGTIQSDVLVPVPSAVSISDLSGVRDVIVQYKREAKERLRKERPPVRARSCIRGYYRPGLAAPLACRR